MNLKTFSQLSRRILIKGVEKKLLYWGFDAKGDVLEEPMAIEGGYILRGEGYDDPTVPHKWSALRNAIQKKDLETVIEEAAYTWFNRFMAIRILSKNQYDQAQLEYEGDSMTPTILAKARRGQTGFLKTAEKQRLLKVLTDYSKEKEAFAILIVGYCDQHQLLRSIFGRIDDYTELLLPDDTLEKDGFIHLLNTTDAISEEDYRKVELIGWLYQFYISEKKDEVFASFKKNKKAEAKDIPAATQIFTPNWIVKYMVQNTAGKLWLDLHPDSALKQEMAYLIHDEAQTQTPIISEAAQLKLLDPAVGSGHILVEGFDLLYAMYMEEYYTVEEAVSSILQHNLFGLDIDNRAVQLAKFAVLLKAAKYYPEVLQKGWMPQIYAMPEPYTFSRQEILDFLGKDGLTYEEELTDTLKLMRDAQNLGSTMIINLSDEVRSYLIRRIQEFEKLAQTDIGIQSVLNRIQPYIEVMSMLTDQYEAVVANPPYMGHKNMNSGLKAYLEINYLSSYLDLMTVFIEMSLNNLISNGIFAIINIPTWMYSKTFTNFRFNLLNHSTILSLIDLGRGVFGSDFGAVSFIGLKSVNEQIDGNYLQLFEKFSAVVKPEIKEKLFLKSKKFPLKLNSLQLLKINDFKIAYWLTPEFIKGLNNFQKVSDFLIVKKGMSTANDDYYLKYWFEVSKSKFSVFQEKNNKCKWFPITKGGVFRRWYGNNEYVVNWENNGEDLLANKKAYVRSKSYYFKEALTYGYITVSDISFRYIPEGFLSAAAGPIVLGDNLNFFNAFLNSKVAKSLIRINSGNKVTFEVGEIQETYLQYQDNDKVNKMAEQNLEISKKDWDNTELSWDFKNHFFLRNSLNCLEEIYEVVKKDMVSSFFQLHKNEEAINEIFIHTYGLSNGIKKNIPFSDVTILQGLLDQNKLNKLYLDYLKSEGYPTDLPIKKHILFGLFVSYIIGVFMGRFRLDKNGLNIADQSPTTEESSFYIYNGKTLKIDEDGIIPLMGTACTFTDDAYQSVRYFLEVVWGEATLTQNLNFLQECLDEDLESYLVKKFWADHCKTYKKKPIYWLFSSDKGAFQVLVYMHRMNAFTVEKIRSNYLMPHLKHLRSQIDRLEATKEDPRLLDRLQKNLAECEAYDLLLKNVADKQITFDLDDGVSRNYELFEGVVRKVK